MTIETRTLGNVLVARLRAESLETGNVTAFRTAIATTVEQHTKVILDLSEVKFMDSTGLGAMLSCLRALKAKNGGLRLAALSPEVVQLFEMVMMDRVFDIYSTVEGAAKTF